jgi:uncharacterized ion transporter superfamily protein YfcC
VLIRREFSIISIFIVSSGLAVLTLSIMDPCGCRHLGLGLPVKTGAKAFFQLGSKSLTGCKAPPRHSNSSVETGHTLLW